MALDLLKSAQKILKTDELTIDNGVFKLHYRATVALLVGSSLIGVAKQYFGDPINCQTASGVSSKVLDDYCWIHSTFHIRTEFQGSVGCLIDPELMSDKQNYIGGGVYFDHSGPSTGIAQPTATPDTSFYQWVPFFLILQASLFIIPMKIWKSAEGGLVASFGKDAKQIVILKGDSENQCKGSIIKEDIARKYSSYFHSILHHNTGYFIQFFLCEVLNLVVVVANIYLTDFFLQGRFMKYGTQAITYLSHDQYTRTEMPNPLCTVFPTITSCDFHSVGTAAGEQKFNSICVMSLNIINEKVYLLLWFWLFGLAILTCLHLVLRLAVIGIPPLRVFMIIVKTRGFTQADLSTCRNVLAHCYLGDWFVLYQLSKNSNIYFFRYLLRYLEKSFDSQARTRARGSSSSHRYAEEDKRRKGLGAGEENGVGL